MSLDSAYEKPTLKERIFNSIEIRFENYIWETYNRVNSALKSRFIAQITLDPSTTYSFIKASKILYKTSEYVSKAYIQGNNTFSERTVSDNKLIPTPSTMVLSYQGKLFYLRYATETDNSIDDINESQFSVYQKKIKVYHVSTHVDNVFLLSEFMASQERSDYIPGVEFQGVGFIRKNPYITPKNKQQEEAVRKIKEELLKEHKSVILLNGPPGTGKSQAIIKACSDLGMRPTIFKNFNLHYAIDVYRYIDTDFFGEEHPVILIEDIDRLIEKHEEMKKEDYLPSISKVELMNLFDGPLTPANMKIIISCNDISKIDPIILREGRCDLQIDF